MPSGKVRGGCGKAGAGPFLNSPTCPDGSFWSQRLERGDEQCEV